MYVCTNIFNAENVVIRGAIMLRLFNIPTIKICIIQIKTEKKTNSNYRHQDNLNNFCVYCAIGLIFGL